MELFVINRYRDDTEDNLQVDQEAINLQKLKQRIEERKKANEAKNVLLTEIILKPPTDDVTTLVKEEKTAEETVPILKEIAPSIAVSIQKNELKQEKPASEFKVLGLNEFEKKKKVKRVLPQWLSHPYSVSRSLQVLTCKVAEQSWLHPTLKETLQSEGVTHLFPVQQEVVPYVLKAHKVPSPFWPNDVCVSAPTGSGKTLAFVLPIIQILMNELGRQVRALVVLPVQELATQVAKVFRKYCTKTGLKVALMSGSAPLRQEQQQLVRYTESNSWVSEVDIIVCTAGRLVEHLQNTEGFSLKNLRFLVIDEADRIMDHIQNDWLYHLDRHIKLDNELMTGRVPSLSWNNLVSQKSPPHKLLFSATLSQDPEKLELWGLFQPKLFSAAQTNTLEDEDDVIRKYTTPDELSEQCIICEAEQKPLILHYLLAEQKWNRILCFANAAQSAHRLAVLLNNMGEGQLKVAEISAALDRVTREMVLRKFHAGEINVLISTDALARGIDVPNCDYVVSYDPPKNIKTYIHRVGRTGRAGRQGSGITMLMHNQVPLFKELLQSGGKEELPQIHIPQDVFDRYSRSYEIAIQETKKQIHGEIDAKVKKSIALKRGYKSQSENRKRKQGFKEKFNSKKPKISIEGSDEINKE